MATISGIVASSGDGFDNNNQDFDILLRALQSANLVEALNDPAADLTVFAPTDAAFVALAQDFGFGGDDEAGAFDAIVAALTELGGGNPLPLLTDVLLYHVSPGAQSQTQLQSAGTTTTLLSDVSFVVVGSELVDNESDLLNPSFVAELVDVAADNGTVQGINRVLIPLDIAGNELMLPEPELPTIANFVGDGFDSDRQDFDILRLAVQTAGLADTLNDPTADLTIFAPTDAAFIALAQDLGFGGSDEAGAFDAIVTSLTELGNGDPIPLVTDILLYHVSPGAQSQSQLQSAGAVTTLLSDTSFDVVGSELVDNEPDLLNPTLVEELADIVAANGTVQGIERVLLPLDIPSNEASPPMLPTIAGIVAASGDGFDSNDQDFDILLQAVQTAGLVDALNDPAADLTVFAPTDAAFVALAQDLGFRGVDEASAFDAIVATLTDLGNGDPVPVLTDILLYHVAPGAQSQAQLQADGTVTTLLTDANFGVEGEALIDNEPDLLNPNFVTALADVAAANGVVQGIDRVLIPLDLPDNDVRVIDGSSGQDFLFGFRQDTVFLAQDGDDFVFGGSGNDQLNGDDGDDLLSGSRGRDVLRGGGDDDFLSGGDEADLLLGGEGSDRLFGNDGADTLLGGTGDDILFGGDGSNVLDGGQGEDRLRLSSGDDMITLRQGDGIDTILGFAPERVSFLLADGLTFADLSFQQGQNSTNIVAGDEVLAQVIGVAAPSLNLEAIFTTVSG
ncbi:MAG: fasciclin domain-containing protein [Cyanobacteria bacterium J06607_6]